MIGLRFVSAAMWARIAFSLVGKQPALTLARCKV